MSRKDEPGHHDPEKATARALGLEAGALDAALDDHAVLDGAWASLDAAERAALEALAQLGGAAPVSSVEAEVAAEAADGLDDGLPEDPSEAAAAASEAIGSLWSKGLVQRDRGTRDCWLWPSLGRALSARSREQLAAQLTELDTPPPPEPDEHLLLCAHAVLRREPLGLTKAGRPHRRALDRLVETLAALLPAGAGADAAEELIGELRRQGLLRLANGELVSDEHAAADWTEASRRGRAARLLDSEWGSPDATLLLRQLRVLPRSSWPLARARRTLRRVLRRSAGDDGTRIGDSRFERALATLRSAGLVARGIEEDSLALTALGRSWPEPADEPPGPTGLHVGNDLALLVPRGIAPAVHLRVSRAARLEAGDVVARYRLDREALLEALDGGEHPDELLAFLEARAEPALPAPVREDLRRWCERFGEVTAHEGIAVACQAHARREEFAALVSRSSLCVELIAPGVAIVTPGDHGPFLDELSAAGFTPRRRVLPPAPAQRRHGGADAPAFVSGGASSPAPDWAGLPAWDEPAEAGRGRRATPPPGQALARLKEKYRREFGRSELAALDELEVDELLELEERGRIRRFLSGLDEAPRSAALDVELESYEGGELVPVSPRRAAAVLELARERGRRCELAWRGEGGKRLVSALEPVEVLEEAGIRYLRARAAGRRGEKLVALDRILGLRVISPRS